MGKQRDRDRRKVDLGRVIDPKALQIAELPSDDDETTHPRNKAHRRATRTRPKSDSPRRKRSRRRGRKSFNWAELKWLVAILRDPAFFATAATLELPPGIRGPDREYNTIQFHLYLRMRKYRDSWRDTTAFFAQDIVHELIRYTLEATWPDHPDRRVGEKPMSRDQFCRHRKGLRELQPESLAAAKASMESHALRQAMNMGYFDKAGSSLANPAPGTILRGDGGFIKALFDAIVGDKVIDEITGEVQQARHDPDGYLGLDDNDNPNPGYQWVVESVTDAAEIERETVVLGFERATEGGEARVAPELIERLTKEIRKSPNHDSRHALYDMALQGTAGERLHTVGQHLIGKLARGGNDSIKSALIEIKDVVGNDGRARNLPIYGVDGLACIEVSINGHDRYVALEQVTTRDRPGGRVLGWYRVPDEPTVHRALVGLTLMVRLDGTTVDGKKRAQYLRWINEHTDVGERLIPQRNTTESVFAQLERLLGLGGRALSLGEFNNTLDLLAYCEQCNLEAAIAHELRTGRDPVGLGPPVPPPRLVAPAAA